MEKNKQEKYDYYLKNHIENVRKAYELLKVMDLNLSKDEYDETRYLIANHDQSKFTAEEYFAYLEYFYGEEKTKEVQSDFDYAWLHHQHNNKHHHQYWLLKKDDGTFKALDMPKPYIIEMICDWWSFSINKGYWGEIINWYEKEKNKMILSENTRKEVERILGLIKDKFMEV